jgi:cytochrome c553
MKTAIFNIAFVMLVLCILTGCRRDMFNQPKSKPLRESDSSPNHSESRPLPLHTVARGQLHDDEAFYTGMIGTNLVTTFPILITRVMLERGRQRFEINCVPCHGMTGEGNGIVQQRGFPAPPSYHLERLRKAPVGHFFDVMTRGYGVMYSQAGHVTPEDRWAIAAYIRALQFSEHAILADVPTNEIARLKSSK